MHQPIHRRTLLRSSGIAMALPFLESMNRAVTVLASPAPSRRPNRLVAIGVPFGFDPRSFVPTTVGHNYELSPHLKHLADYRDDFTVISGLSHPSTGSGMHKAEAVMLTGAAYPDYSHNLRNTISIDQRFAAQFHGQTRYSSLVLSTYNGTLSYTSNGVAIPSVNRPSEIFRKLFLTNTAEQADDELKRIDEGRSLLDLVGEQAKRLNRRISVADRERVDEYFSSVRDVERQLQLARNWVNRPKPTPIGEVPQDITDDTLQSQKLQLMMDMIHLALLTDSARAITIKTFGMHHEYTHHGLEPKKLAKCRAVEIELIQAYGGLLKKLKSSRAEDGTLLDRTMVLMTSNLRDGNTHWTHDLPVVFGGGSFRHGQHLAFNRPYVQSLASDSEANLQKPTRVIAPVMGRNQTPLCNLYTSMLQSAGIDTDRFGSGTGTLTGL